jgi:hypothetical protein
MATNEFNKILDSIKSITDGNIVSIFIPSDNKEVLFKPLTAKQQKDIIKTAIEKNTSGVRFLEALNQIIQDNSLEKKEYIVSDRSFIITLMRCNGLASNYTTESTVYDLNILSGNKIPMGDDLKSRVIKTPEFNVYCKIPSLAKDSVYNTEIIKRIEAKNSATSALGDLFILEVAKYIEKVESVNLGFTANLDDYNMHQRYQLMESLPAKVYNMVVDYINDAKSKETEFFKKDGVYIDIEMDPTFFTA